MRGIENSYFSLAENDYMFFKNMPESVNFPNSICAIWQNICERYLKHIVNEYYTPNNDAERKRQSDVLHTHNLSKLCNFIRNDLHIDMSYDTKDEILKADGYYFTTRYPGTEFMVIDESDIRRCSAAVEVTRNFTLEVMKAQERITQKEAEQEEQENEEDYER